jgi:hypothetical protein
MKDAQRYRMNAAECISAAERCEPAYRDLTLAIAEAWLSLASQQEAMDELLAIWTQARSATSKASLPIIPSRPAASIPNRREAERPMPAARASMK